MTWLRGAIFTICWTLQGKPPRTYVEAYYLNYQCHERSLAQLLYLIGAITAWPRRVRWVACDAAAKTLEAQPLFFVSAATCIAWAHPGAVRLSNSSDMMEACAGHHFLNIVDQLEKEYHS
jgi:hypothetical protein